MPLTKSIIAHGGVTADIGSFRCQEASVMAQVSPQGFMHASEANVTEFVNGFIAQLSEHLPEASSEHARSKP
jgi:hypothetical protein